MIASDNDLDLAEREGWLDEVLTAYLKARDVGRPPGRDELLAAYPDLAAPLGDFLRDEGRLDRLAAPLRAAVSRLAGAAPLPVACRGPAPPASADGPRFGDYELLEQVGQGGMGVVYRARQVSLNRPVALKMIRPGVCDGPEARARFRTEARAAARLGHANVVQVHEVGDLDGHPYIALEYVEGGSLAQRLDGTPFAAVDAARLVETLARAVHHAHQRGVVHRDLKPSNILLQLPPAAEARGHGGDNLNPEDEKVNYSDSPPCPHAPAAGLVPKITDFGLAKQLDAADGHRTETGAIVGTPAYMAPEQAEGRVRDLGPATDLFALGAVLYELLTGRPPFQGATRLDTLRQVVADVPVSPRSLNARVPRDLETICLKCLEKEPQRRYASAALLAEDLRRFLAGESILARPAGRVERFGRWCRRNPVLAALAAALLLSLTAGLGLVTGQWRRAEDNLAEARQQEAEARRNFEEAELQRQEAEAGFRTAHRAVQDFAMRVSERELPDVPGLQPLRKELLEGALSYYQNFLRKRGRDRQLRAEMADTHFRVARITNAIGPAQDALAAYGRALALYEELLGESPGNRSYREELAHTCNNMGILHGLLHQPDKARGAFQRAAGLYRELLRAEPNRIDLIDSVASACNNLGAQHAEAGELEAALASLEEARDLRERGWRGRDDVPDFLAKLGAVHDNLAVVLDTIGRPKEAAASQRRALALRERLVEHYPARLSFQSELADSYGHLAERQRLAGQTDEALAALQKGHAILERLVRANPRVTRYRTLLAVNHLKFGKTHRDAGDIRAALKSLHTARGLLGELARQEPGAPYYRAEQATCWFFIGVAHANAGNKHDALEAYRASRDLLERLVREAPDRPDYHSDLGTTLNNLGVIEAQLDRFGDGLAALRRAVEHQRVAFGKAPQTLRYRHALNSHYGSLGEVHRAMRRPDEAVAATLERVKLWPDNPGELYLIARDLALAAAAVGRGRTLSEEEEAQRGKYLDLSLQVLRKALDGGFKDRARMRKEPAFALLRERDDFNRLLNRAPQQGK